MGVCSENVPVIFLNDFLEQINKTLANRNHCDLCTIHKLLGGIK